jgi:hypothetical protein
MSLKIPDGGNEQVAGAIAAFQAGNKVAWLAAFTADARLFDDGNPRDFRRFTDEAIGHERFTAIDTIEADGLGVVGTFHSYQWGDFRTYFRFRLGADGRFDRLEIGQA